MKMEVRLMSFYDLIQINEKNEYIKFLKLVGSLSRLFSENAAPYLDSRICENLFCRCFGAENIARQDCTADAKKGKIGIGIKTWVGNSQQKIAEFNKARPEYAHLTGIDKVKKIAELRNERIRMTLRIHGLEKMIYHVTVRESGKIKIYECPLEEIDIDKIRILEQNNKSISFTDNINKYSFNISKSVLLKKFDDMELKETIDVVILDNPYKLLEDAFLGANQSEESKEVFDIAVDYLKPKVPNNPFIYLRLYSYLNNDINNKYVPVKSGLNQWNAGGRARNMDEIYIPISREDHRRTPGFFPDRDTPFTLLLPNGKSISAKVCQDASKALMSNPNSSLGKWLLRDVFKLKHGELLTYSFLRKMGIDSVKIEKLSENSYKINFALLGSYENWMIDYRVDDYED